MEEKYFIVRGDRSGVFFGNIKERKGQETQMTNVRKIWYWDGANAINELAKNGTKKPAKCKFTVEVENLTITDAIEIIECTKEAVKIIKGVPEWIY